MAQDAPRWIDSGDLNWSPEEELRFAGDAKPARNTRRDAPTPVPQPANSDEPGDERLLKPRLAIGLGQGLALFALLRARDLGLLPDPYLFSTLCLPLLFAPLLVLEGMGRIPARALAAWTVAAIVILAGLGFYQRWRIDVPLPAHAGYALVMLSALFLFIAQALIHAASRAGKIVAPYPEYFRESWTLAARLLVWAAITGAVWAVVGGIGGYLNAARLPFAPALVTMPLTGLMSAFAFSLLWPARFRNTLLAALTIAQPVLLAASILLAIAAFAVWRAPLWLIVGDAVLVIVALNASYRGGPDDNAHPFWRRLCEFIGACVIPALAGLAAAALAARVAQHGWTPNRLFAATAIAFIVCTGIATLGAGMVSLGGGGWMQRIEEPNITLAFALMAAVLLLASPLGDPMRLAAVSQSARLTAGAVPPDGFDFAALARDDARFGYEALQSLSHNADPEIARAASLTLTSPPRELLPPTAIGANIAVRTPGAMLPAALLERDWTDVKGAPPCLSSPRMACEAWFLDLDGDGRDEILLAYGDDSHWWATAMKLAGGAWSPAGTLASPDCRGALAALRDGHFTISAPLPRWQDILAGGSRLNFSSLNGRPACRH